MITVTALKWVPDFAQGQVRDHRVRWVLNEVGWPYEVRLLDTEDQQDPDYRCQQPFGQVPALVEDGRAPLFETGAILVDVATRSGQLLPENASEHPLAISWMIAALNTIEPNFMMLAQVDFFIDDEDVKAKLRPLVIDMIELRLRQLSDALGERDYLVADRFTIADLMMSSVLKIIGHTDILDHHPSLARYRDRCLERPAYKKAIADQCTDLARHRPEDMRYDKKAAI